MAIRPRIRRKVQAARRASDGSAFQKCEECGVMIAVALFDMHECGKKIKEVKRFKGISSGKIDKRSEPIGRFEDEPRSPFIFFLEDFRENYGGNLVDTSRICFNVWKKMSPEEQRPFNARANEVDLAHSRKLNEEAKTINKRLLNIMMANLQVDDEADSKFVGEFDKFYESFVYHEDDEGSDTSDHFEHEFWEDDTLLKY